MSTTEPSPTPPSPSKSSKTAYRPDRQATSLLDRDDPGGVDSPYDKVSLTKTLQDMELNLEQSKVLPLINPFGTELSNGLSLGPMDIQFILEYQTRWPLTYFDKTNEGIKVVDEPSSTTFIFFGGQPFFISHQRSLLI